MARRSNVFRLSLILTLAILSAAGLAEAQRPMTVLDLLNLPSLSDPQLSPDGQQLLYVQS